jgi:type III secretion system chaperone YscW
MKKTICLGMLCFMALSGCSHSIPEIEDKFDQQSQAQLNGWISVGDYFSPAVTKVEVEMCQVIGKQCLRSAFQEYKGIQLPIQYSFLISPLQAGNGEMKIKVRLLSSTRVIANKVFDYQFFPGNSRIDLVLETKNKDQ